MFEIGNSLREARLRRSIDVVQAEQATKIRAKYLRALEEEQFSQLPSQTYAKGFLRTYADYLGLDGQLYVDEFNSRFVAGDDADARPRRSNVRPERRNRRVETNIVLLALTVVAIITVVVISAWQSSGSGSPSKPKPAHRPHTVKTPKAHTSYGLEITGVGVGSYVEVHEKGPGGKLLFQGTIAQGRTEPFKGRAFWANLVSPEHLVIRVSGRTIHLTGLKPQTLTVTRHGVQVG